MKKISIYAILFGLTFVGSANALQYSYGNSNFKLNASGSAGIIEPKFKDTLFLGDFELGARYTYAITDSQKLGLVYEYDAYSIDENDFAHDAFALWEMRGVGRIEAGLTESAAHKLGVGIPDVGGLRIYNKPLFYKKILPRGNIIPNTSISTGHDAPRLNVVTAATDAGQYGLSVAAFGGDYDYAIDGGVKFRFPDGKLKSALSLGASFMDKPHGFSSATYAPDIYADWRVQGSVGYNLQYNSWIWGTSAVVIYDENPIGTAGDGISAGTGVSYDLLNYSVSLSYIYSHTGLWHEYMEKYREHTVVGSVRYKYDEYVSMWLSIGLITETPFVTAAMKLEF